MSRIHELAGELTLAKVAFDKANKAYGVVRRQWGSKMREKTSQQWLELLKILEDPYLRAKVAGILFFNWNLSLEVFDDVLREHFSFMDKGATEPSQARVCQALVDLGYPEHIAKEHSNRKEQ